MIGSAHLIGWCALLVVVEQSGKAIAELGIIARRRFSLDRKDGACLAAYGFGCLFLSSDLHGLGLTLGFAG